MPWGCFPGSRQPHPITFQTHQAMGVRTRARDSAGEPSKAGVCHGMGVSVRKDWRARPPTAGAGLPWSWSQTTRWKETLLRPRALRGGEGDQRQSSRRQSFVRTVAYLFCGDARTLVCFKAIRPKGGESE